MGILTNSSHPAATSALWQAPDLSARDALFSAPIAESDIELAADENPPLQMAGKTVFITVQGARAGATLAAEYTRIGATVAFLDITELKLHILPPRSGFSAAKIPGSPVRCRSWGSAIEEVIARLGPIHLWFDMRDMTWPAVSRIGAP